MKIKLEVRGMDQLMRRAARVQASVAGACLGRVVMAGAQVIEGEAKVLCPVDTGNLRNSLHSELISASGASAEAHVGTSVEYGPYQELGTKYMEANPYLRPAADTKQQQVASAMGAVVKKELAGALSGN